MLKVARRMSDLIYPGNQRINECLLEYWTQKKGDRLFPKEGEIDPGEIDEIWDSCFLVRTDEGEGSDYQYTYLGQSLVEAYGDDLNNKEVCEKLIYPTCMSLVHKFDEVREKKQPVTEESEFTNTKGMLIKFRSCMLPLGKEGSDDVSFIIGGMKWKAF